MRKTEFKQTQLTYITFIVVFIILGLSSYVVIAELKRRTHTADLVVHAYQVINAIKSAISTLDETDKQLQFYRFTHNQRFVALHQLALDSMHNSLTELKKLTAGDSNQQKKMNEIKQILDQYESTQDKHILFSNKNIKNPYVINGLAQLNEIKALLHTMITEEYFLLQQRTKKLDQERYFNYVSVIISSLFVFMLLLFSFPIIMQLIKKNELQQLELIHKEHERMIAQSMERAKLEFTLDAAKLGYWNLNLSDMTTERSLLHDQIFGYKSRLPIWTYEMFLTHVHPEDKDMVHQAFKHSTETEAIWTFVCRIYRVDDHALRWITATSKIFQIGEKKQMIGLIQDITDKKELEALLAESEERWKYALESAKHGVWDWHVPEKIIYFSPAWKSMLGYEEDEIKNKQIEFESRVHPDDIKKIWNCLNDHFEGKTKEYSCEVRFRCKDGTNKWILDQGKVVSRGPDGQVLRAIGTHTDISELKKTEMKLKHVAEHDSLTGLANRIIFEVRLDEAIAISKRQKSITAVLFMDIDGFKQINDKYGHLTGDLLLKKTAARLKKCIREIDTLARFGGDEFALLLLDLKEEKAIYRIVQKIIKSFSKEIVINHLHLVITLSIGIALYPKDGALSLIQKADAAMYYVKHHGKNNFKLYDETLKSDI